MKKPNVPDNQPANSWMYAITTEFADKDYVPPEAIKGAWHVDETRSITDNFKKNDNFIPGLISSRDWPRYLEKIAMSHPSSWVYDIEKKYRHLETVPNDKIIGSWKVDENGKILPVFYPNKNYMKS